MAWVGCSGLLLLKGVGSMKAIFRVSVWGLVGLLAALVLAMPGEVSANGVSCPLTITEDTNLDFDLTCAGTAIVIAADNVVLDGKGHVLQGDGTGNGVEINGRSGVVVKNLTIEGFSIGISLYQTSASQIEKNTLLTNNRGIRSFDSSQNLIEKNYLDHSYLGIRLLGSSNDNVVAQTLIVNTTANALNIESDTNIVFENVLRDNTWGISLYAAMGNTVEKNEVYGTTADGFRLSGSSAGNTVDKNLVTGSGWNGWSVDSTSSGNSFDKNESTANSRYGFLDASAGSGTSGTANTYTDNICDGNGYGGSSPTGLCG
jgi:parallel beta-helix repeat protein